MLLTVHTLAGEALGSFFPPNVYGLLMAGVTGWASHFLLDALPHTEQPFGKEIKVDHNWGLWDYPRRIFYSALTDCLLATWLLFVFGLRDKTIMTPIFFGGLGAMVPDLLDNMPIWSRFTRRFVLTRWHYHLHRWWHVGQWQETWPRWCRLFTQVLVVILALWVLL